MLRYMQIDSQKQNYFDIFHLQYIFISLQVEKNFIVCTRNLWQNSYTYLLLYSYSFAFVNVLISFWQTRNNDELPERIILLSPLQISREFLYHCLNVKRTLVIASAICLRKKPRRLRQARNCARK